MNRTETRTVLLARPGEARAQLQAALEQVGLDLVLVADPLETGQAQVLSLQPDNLVMVMDAEVEEVLERFDDLLALDDCRILFEEAELIATRAGWDVARWSRHLSAKLLGHGDVLPAGHEADPVTATPAASQQADALATAADMAQPAEPETPVAEQFEPEPVVDVAPGVEALDVAMQAPVADSAQQALVEPPEATEMPKDGTAAASAVSDYTDYDDLDAFSFLDQEAIEAAHARDAEAAAIRQAEAEAETALRAEALAGFESQEQAPADSPVVAGDADAQAVAAASATWVDDYDAVDSLSFLAENAAPQAAADEAGTDPVQGMADAPPADAPPLFDEPVDLGGWQMPAELEAISPQTGSQPEQNAGDESAGSALIDTAVTAESAAALPDWSVYQDFDAISKLPDAAHIENSGYREALAPIEPSDLAPEEAYQRVEEDLRQFDAPVAQDEWQDFERPTLAPEIAQDELAAAAPRTGKPDDKAESIEGRVQQLFETVSQWSLSDISLSIDEGNKRPAFERHKDGAGQADPQEPELKFSSPSIAAMSGTTEADPGLAAVDQQEGAVLLLGGIGGPDPLRQILQNLPTLFPVPVLVQQWLDGGHYDRLQRQMERVCQMPVLLAQPGMMAEHSKVYIVPCSVGVLADSSSQLRFVAAEGRDFANLLDVLPSTSSVAVLLSGASDAFVEPLLRFQQGGGKLLAQSEEGCYDHAMPALMASRGAQLDTPAGIAARIKALWSTTELK